MAGPNSLDWKGGALLERLRKAQVYGVNKTMEDCVVEAKESHPWQTRSGVLEGSIGIAENAHEKGGGVTGVWGSKANKYALIQELGGTITPKAAKALKIPQPDGSLRFAKSVTLPPRPYLRPAADKHYPSLAGHIKEAMDHYARKSGGDGTS